MQKLRLIGKVISKTNLVMAVAGAVVIVLLMFYNLVGTLSRYFARMPVPGVTEISGYLLAFIVFMGLPYTLEQGGHIHVDTFVKYLGPRKQQIARALSALFVAFVGFFFCWKGFDLSLSKINVVSSSELEIWLFPFYLVVPVGSLLLLVQSLKSLFLCWREMWQNQE